MENRNMLTTNATAQLLHSIVGGVAVSAARSLAMMTMLKRSRVSPGELAPEVTDQVTGFLGGGLPQNTQLWSKAGWTSQVRHDAAYIELTSQRPYLLVVFTEGRAHSQNQAILPFVSQQIAEAVATLV